MTVASPPRWAVRTVVTLAADHPELTITDIARRTGLRPMFVRAYLMGAGTDR